MGQADSSLPELARISPQFTLLPFIMAFWWHNRSYTGWAFSAATVAWWQYAMRMGVGINNPLNLYTLTDLTQGTYIYLVVFGTLILACAMCGTGIAYLLDMPYPIPLEMLLPASPGHVLTSPLGGDDEEQRLSQQDAMLDSRGGVNAFGYSNLKRPYGQIIVTMIAFMIAVAAPFIMFEYIFPYSDWGAFLGALLVILLGYIGLGIYLTYKAALPIYGVTADNTKEREMHQNLLHKDDNQRSSDPDIGDKERAFARTRWAVWKFILITGGLHLFGTVLWFGIAAFATPPDIDAMWISEIAVIGAITLIIALIVIIYSRVMKSKHEAQQLLEQRTGGGGQKMPDDADTTGDDQSGGGGSASGATTTTTTTTGTSKNFNQKKAVALTSFLLPKGPQGPKGR